MRRARSSRWATLLASVLLAGCWRVPLPPNDSSTDAYGWRAPIEISGSQPYYRLQLSGELLGWMKQHSIESPAIFDADGKLQPCGSMSAGLNNPLSTLPTTIQGRITRFDPAACGSGPMPKMCFKNRRCDIPAFCSPQIVDVTGTSLEGMTTVGDILAAAHSFPVPVACRPDLPEAQRACNESDAAAREAARRMFNQKTEAMEFIDNFGLTSESQGSMPSPHPTDPSRLDRNDLLIAFDTVPPEVPILKFQWNKPSGFGHAGTATLTCYNPDGSTSDNGLNIEPNGPISATGPMLQYIGVVCRVRNYRLKMNPSVPDLALEAVTATTFAPKPFMREGATMFWTAPRGRAPYSVYLEPGRSGCSNLVNVAETEKLPHARDADWPVLTGDIGAPQINSRGAWVVLLANNRDIAAWLYWIAYVGGAFVLAALATLLRWAWLASRGRSLE